MKAHARGHAQRLRQRVDFPVHPIHTRNVELDVAPSGHELRECPEQHALVLDEIQARHLYQAHRPGRVARDRLARGECLAVDAERNTHGARAELTRRLDDRRTRGTHHGRALENPAIREAMTQAQAATVADVVKTHELTAREMYEVRPSDPPGRERSDEPDGTRPDRMHEIERRAAVLGADRLDDAQVTQRSTIVHHLGTQHICACGRRGPVQQVHLHGVACRKTADQPHERRNGVHRIVAHPARRDQRDLHARFVNNAARAVAVSAAAAPRSSRNFGSRRRLARSVRQNGRERA